MIPYNSALKNGGEGIEVDGELSFYESEVGVTFQHDLSEGFHEQFSRADVIFSGLSWRAGYRAFAQRAGVEAEGPHGDYLQAVQNTIDMLDVPAFIIIGRHALNVLDPDQMFDIAITEGNTIVPGAVLMVFNADLVGVPKTSGEMLKMVAASPKWDTLLDFSCGFGEVARAALAAGKRFVCSDINAKCIYYIAQTMMGYSE